MIFLFTAPKNSYFLFRERELIKERAKEAHDLWASFDLENWPKKDELNSLLSAKGFFEEEKSLVFKNATLLSIDQAGYLKELIKKRKISKDKETKLYFLEEAPSKKAPLYVFLKKQAEVFREIKNPTGIEFENFLKEEAHRLKIEIEPQAVKRLGFWTKFDPWEAIKIMERAFLVDGGQKVTEKKIEEMVENVLEENIFLALEALARKEKGKALDLFGQARINGGHPLYLLSMITYQIRTLAIIKSVQEKGLGLSEISREAGIHPYVVEKNSSLLEKMGMDQIKKIYQKLAEIDFSIKTGKLDPFLALDLFVIFS